MSDAPPLFGTQHGSEQNSIDAIYGAVAEAMPVVRTSLTGLMRRLGVDGSVIDDVALAVTEACTNVVVHAYRNEPKGSFRVVAGRGGGGLRVEVTDDGRGPAPRMDSPGLGLGLPLMAALTKSLEVRSADDGHGTLVTMVFDAAQANPDPPPLGPRQAELDSSQRSMPRSRA